MSVEQDLLAALREIKAWQMAGFPAHRYMDVGKGLCLLTLNNDIIDEEDLGEAEDLLEISIEKWSKFSGNRVFPVPSPPRYELDEADAYFAAENMWEGEYGALRIELLDHCIAYFEERVQ